MNLDESINEVKKVFFDTKKIKCEDCKYKTFSTNMEKLQFTIEELNLIKTEFLEKTEYENNRFSKIFKSAITFVGAPALGSFLCELIKKYLLKTEKFLVGSLTLIFVLIFLYIVVGGPIASFLWTKDSCGKNAKEKQLIRFLDKYIKERKWESIHSK